MTNKWLALILGIIFLTLPSNILAAVEEIHWPVFHFPPLFFVEGDDIKGYGAHAIRLISQQMPEYQHKLVKAQPVRIFGDMKRGKKYLAYGAAKTPEREKYLAYSLPCRLSLNDTVIMKPEKAKKYLAGSKISLKKLLGDPSLVMGQSRGYSYGKEIDQILNTYGGRNKQEILAGVDAESRKLKMLQSDRIDWMLWDPLSIEILKKNAGISVKLTAYEISELSSSFTPAYLVAPRTEWGIQMIKRVNLALRKILPTDEFYNGLSRWVPEELKPSFRQAYKDLIITPNKQNN
jgi:polar amino acid transport system substrate-binding protein